MALAVAALYRRRWAIKELFRTLRTKGFDIEARRITEPAPRGKLVAAISVRQDQAPEGPDPKRSLADFAWVYARLGGWTGYDGKPGSLVMLDGWLELRAAERAAHAIGQRHDLWIR